MLDNIGGLCDPRYNGRLMENVSLMEYLIHYGVTFAGQPRDQLLRQATIAPEDASLLDSMWSSVCVCGSRGDNEKKRKRTTSFRVLFVQ